MRRSGVEDPGSGQLSFRSGRSCHLIAAICLTLLVTGCTVVGPDFELPSVPIMSDWLKSDIEPEPDLTLIEPKADPVARWWTVFNDPVLDRLVEIAYKENLTLRVAAVRIFEARAQLGIVIGDQYPQQQTVGTDYKHEKISTSFGVVEDINQVVPINPTFSRWQLGFDAGWELDLWGQVRRGIESADANLVAQIADYDDVLVTLTGDVASTYVTIRTLEERLALVLEDVADQKESLRITEIRYDNGATTELDVQEATALLNNTEAMVPALESALRQAKNALSYLLGMPPGNLEDILGGPGKIPVPPADVAIGVPAELLRRRPDIRAAELEAAAQSAQIGVALADLYPSFAITGSVGLQASTFAEMFSGNSLAGFINPGFSWNVLNYGRIRNNVRVQDARLQELLVNYQNTVLNAYGEVEDALVAFVQTQREAGFLSNSVDASKEAVRIALLQYQDGTADYTRVLNTQTSLVRSQDQLTATRGDIVNNLIAVYKALGGGWQIREGQDFLPAATKQQMRERTDWGDLLGPGAIPAEDEQLEPPPSPEPPTLFRRPPDW
jgi:NodT family efflux transporter outer membrane factor (OMF) lipoprotein